MFQLGVFTNSNGGFKSTESTAVFVLRKDKTRQIYYVCSRRTCVIARDVPDDIRIHYCVKC